MIYMNISAIKYRREINVIIRKTKKQIYADENTVKAFLSFPCSDSAARIGLSFST